MKSLARSLAVAALLCLLLPHYIHAQNTTVTASALKMKLALIPSGMVTFTPVDAASHAVPFQSAGLNSPQAFACRIANGALSGCSVPDLCMASPANLKYQISISAAGYQYTFPQPVANVCGTTWPLDAYVPPATTSSYTPISSGYGTAVPTGACPNAAEYVRNGNGGELYICVNTAWVLVTSSGAGGVPGGSDKQVQFNDAGVFGGDVRLTWDRTAGVLVIGGSKLIPLGGQVIHGPINSGPQESTLDASLQQWINLADTNVITAKSTDISAGLSVYSQNHFDSNQTASAIYAVNHTTGTSSANGIHGVGLADPGPGVTNTEFVVGLLGSAQLGTFATFGMDTGNTPVLAALYAAAGANLSSQVVPIETGLYVENQSFGNATEHSGIHIVDQGSGPGHYGIYIAGGNNNLGPNTTTAGSFAETLTTPASSSAACTAGQFTDDADYHYVCTSTNTWKRVALSAF